MSEHELDWSQLAFGSKSTLRNLRATFIAAPRDISIERLKQLVKMCLPKGNIVLGIANEQYIDGFEGQPQFTTLQLTNELRQLITKVNAASNGRSLTILHYFQRELPFILEKGGFTRAVFVNGSWHRAFHHRSEYYTLVNQRVPYDLVSAFADETEARAYAVRFAVDDRAVAALSPKNASAMMKLANHAASQSFDYTFQTGCVLGEKQADGTYRPLLTAHNTVVPYETYALLHGSIRERHFAPFNDLNYYDTAHFEMTLVTHALRYGVTIRGASLFATMLPCPTCARVLALSELTEIIYQHDHSDGYSLTLLEEAGKRVRRLVAKDGGGNE